jgi:hypothetical protein
MARITTEASEALQTELGFNLLTEAMPTTSDVVLPFFALKLTTFLPGGDSLVPEFAWNATPYNALAMDLGSTETTGTVTASDVGYRTMSTDDDGVVTYPALMSQSFRIERRFALDPGESSISEGGSMLTLVNVSGQLDSLFQSWNVDNRPVAIYYGEKTFDNGRGIFLDPSFDDLDVLFIGLGAPWKLAANELKAPVRDATYWLERPLQKTRYAGTGTYEGTTDLKNRPKPKARGGTSDNPINNVTPVLIDPDKLIYQYSDGPGTVVSLYEGGKKTITFDADTTDLYTGTTASGKYRTDDSRGLFQLATAPARQITCDVTGEFPIAGAQTTIASIARYLMTEDLSLPSDNIDTTSFTTADTNFNYVAGIYFAPDDSPDGVTAVDRVVSSIGGQIIQNRDGELQLFVLRVPTGDADMALDTTKIIDLQPVDLPATLSPPPFRVRVNYQHNYTVQTSDIFDDADADHRQFIASADRIAAAVDTDVSSALQNPNDVAPFGGALLDADDAAEVADDILTLWSAGPQLYEVPVPLSVGITLEIGNRADLTFPLGPLRGGKKGQIVRDALDTATSTYTIFVLA